MSKLSFALPLVLVACVGGEESRCEGSACTGGKADSVYTGGVWHKAANSGLITEDLELVGPGLESGQIFAGPTVGAPIYRRGLTSWQITNHQPYYYCAIKVGDYCKSKYNWIDLNGLNYSVWAAQGTGLIRVHQPDGTYTDVQTPAQAELRSLWGNPWSIYAVGDQGTIIRSEDRGATWSLMQTPTTKDLFAIGVDQSDRLAMAVGEDGTILRLDVTTDQWVAEASGTSADLFDVWSLGFAEAVAVGEAGTVLERSAP
jgi:hypothetical protein